MRHDLLIPVQRFSRLSGQFRWPSAIVLASPSGGDLLPLGQLSSDLKRRLGGVVRIERSAYGDAAVRVRRDGKAKQGPEGYRLTITPKGVEIVSAADAGAYYALQTLRELQTQHGRSIPACVIEDWPDFARRGVYCDCSRGKVPTLETLKALVERMAKWKINELQLYIENVFSFRRHPLIGRGFDPLTAGELLELQDHCKLHHVRLVGSLSSFGHMEKILCLKPYAHLAETPGAKETWAMTLCPTDPGSIKLVTELYEEFVPLFEADDFNVCCDETWELGKGRSKKLADRVGVGRVYLDFLLKLHRLCERHGKRMNAWADIVLEHPELLRRMPRDVVMLNWDYNAGGNRIPRTREIAAAGLPLMVCPGTSSWQTHGTRLQNAIGNVANFAAQGRKHRAQGLLNTDWGDDGHRNLLGVSLHGFAHGAAHSWNGLGVNDKRFTENFTLHAFGDESGKLAASLRLLGATYNTVSDAYGNHSATYAALIEPLLPKGPQKVSQIGQMKEKGLPKVIADLGNERLWPATKGMDKFEALAIEEFAQASWMDVVACRRALAARKLRAGKSVPALTLRALAQETGAMGKGFARLWLARNKRSRLADNLRAFASAANEAKQLSRLS